MALAVIVITLLGANEVSLAVVPGAPCVEQARLASRLESAGLRVVGGTSPRLAVTIRPEPQGVMVRASRQGASFERAIPAQVNACGSVERVVAALITSWSLQLPAPETTEPRRAVVAASPPAAAPEPVAEMTPIPVEELTPPPAAPPPARKALPADAAAPTAPLADLRASQPTTSADSGGLPFTVDLAVLGGGNVGATPSISGVGQLQLGLSLGRFGVLIEGGLDSGRMGNSGSTRVESSTQWLSLSGRASIRPVARLRLDLALGFRLWRIAAQSFNTLNARSIELLGLGGVLSVGGSLQVAGPLWVQLRGFTSVRTARQQFSIDGLGPVLALEPWEGGLLLGLELRLFDGG